MATATLTAIQNKVRKLTRSPSTNQLSATNLNEYINTFIAYDFPEELRLFKLHKAYDLVLTPFVDQYDLSTLTNSDGETLSNAILTINPPVYVDGYKAYYSQSRDDFFNIYPPNLQIVFLQNGNGGMGAFTGTVNGLSSTSTLPNTGPFILPNTFSISCLDRDWETLK